MIILCHIIVYFLNRFLLSRYGWHFPELGKIITDNLAFVKTVEFMGTRDNAKNIDLSEILPEEVSSGCNRKETHIR